MNRRPRFRLDLLHPDVSGRVRRKQEQQKATHYRHTRKRSFKVGDLVSVKNQGAGAPWLPGVIEAMVSLDHCVVQLVSGRTIQRHVDHLQHRAQCEESSIRSPCSPEPLAPDDDSPDPQAPDNDLPDTDTATPQQPVNLRPSPPRSPHVIITGEQTLSFKALSYAINTNEL